MKMKGILRKGTENTGMLLDENIESIRGSCKKKMHLVYFQNQLSGVI